jgi:hypothetical protein
VDYCEVHNKVKRLRAASVKGRYFVSINKRPFLYIFTFYVVSRAGTALKNKSLFSCTSRYARIVKPGLNARLSSDFYASQAGWPLNKTQLTFLPLLVFYCDQIW